ncbi:MAG TPA: hypothetical protein VFX70_07295 [Mycobacteriales bacterium]|nr:hypothetical protein [Mycobacteriales bacterium]
MRGRTITRTAAPTPFRVASWNIRDEFSRCPALDDAGAAGKVTTMVKLTNDHDLNAVMFQETFRCVAT